MTEKERLKYIEDRRKQRSMEYGTNRPRGSVHMPSGGKKATSLGFRTYVAIILTGGIFTISLFPSDTSLKICNMVKSAIQEEMSKSQMELVRVYIEQIMEQGGISPESIDVLSNTTNSDILDIIENSPVKIQEEAQEKMVYYPDIGDEP